MSIDAIRTALLKVVSNMPSEERRGELPLVELVNRGVISRPDDVDKLYEDCYEAARSADAEARVYPAPVSIYFSQGVKKLRNMTTVPWSIFAFERLATGDPDV